MRPALFIIFLILSTSSLLGQSKREWIGYGDEAFKNEDYHSAAAYYKKIFDEDLRDGRKRVHPYETHRYRTIEKKDTSAKGEEASAKSRAVYVTRRIARSYLLGNAYDKAIEWHEKLMADSTESRPKDRVGYARALMEAGSYQKALQELQAFNEVAAQAGKKLMLKAQRLAQGCHFALDENVKNEGITVKETEGAVNDGSSDMAPRYTDEIGSLIFASARIGNKTEEEEEPRKARFTTDLYMAPKDPGSFEEAKNIGSPVNSPQLEGAAVLSIDKKKLYFTRCEKKDPTNCGIYLSRKLGGDWLKPMLLSENVNAEGFSSMHPMLAEGEKTLYFVSNRPGGEGKMDLWSAPLDARGLPGQPVNLGPTVNTPEDELSPYYSEKTNILFFSSEGHVGMGGLDIFKAHGQDSSWREPMNLRPPVNSPKDELYYTMDEQLEKGHFTSDRQSCDTCKDGSYCYRIYSYKGKPKLYKVEGTVYDQKSGDPIPNSLVTIKDVSEEQKPIYVTTDQNGHYEKQLQEGIQYFIKAQKVDHFGDAVSISTKKIDSSKTFHKDLHLERIPEEEVRIKGIRYDLDKATLREAAKKRLDTLTDFLQLNDNLVIEIRAHTDVRGSKDYNQDLSKRRAKSVVDYLIKKGIDPKRLKSKGFGESKPAIKNAETEEEHQRNRRTTFKTLRQDYKDITR